MMLKRQRPGPIDLRVISARLLAAIESRREAVRCGQVYRYDFGVTTRPAAGGFWLYWIDSASPEIPAHERCLGFVPDVDAARVVLAVLAEVKLLVHCKKLRRAA